MPILIEQARAVERPEHERPRMATVRAAARAPSTDLRVRGLFMAHTSAARRARIVHPEPGFLKDAVRSITG